MGSNRGPRLPGRASAARTPWINALLVVIAPVVFFAVLEGILWAVAAVYWRSESLDSPPHDPQATKTILALGDSFTYGLFLETGDSYPAQLRHLLRDKHEVRWNVDVVGRPGHSPMMLHMDIDAILQTSQPDLVLLLAGFNINDGDVVYFREHSGEGLPPPRALDRVNVALQRFRTYRVLSHGVRTLRPSRDAPVYVPKGRMDLFSFRAYQEVNRFALRELIAEITGRGIAVMLLNYPQAPVPPNAADEADEYYYAVFMGRSTPLTPDDYIESRRDGEIAINAVIRGLSEEVDVPLVDNFAVFDVIDDKSPYFVEDDEHPNRRGYALMAAAVEEALIATGHLESTSTRAASN